MDDTLIRAARLFDGESDACREQAFVTTQGEHITGVGSQSELGSDAASRFRQIIDLDDSATLLPGLINMHTHMSFSGGDNVYHDAVHDTDPVRMLRIANNLRAALASGVTTIRDCGTPPHLALPVRDAVAKGLFPGPRIIASGAITTTGGHCWYCATEADDEASIRKAVREHVKAGTDFIKLFATGGNLTPGTNSVAAQFNEQELCAATEEARRLDRRSAAHAHGTAGVMNSIKARVTTIEHCSFLSASGIGFDETIARQIADLGIYVCHTIFRGVSRFEDDADHALTAGEERQITSIRARLELTRRLSEAGVVLVAGNDAGVSHVSFSDFPGDLVLTTQGCGFSPLTVLKSATSVAAQALGRSDIGRLRPAAAADLLAVRGDPSSDIRAIEQPLWVMARGNIVRHDALTKAAS